MPDRMVIQTKEGPLEDFIYESPVDVVQHRRQRLFLWGFVLVGAALVGYLLWYFLQDRTEHYADVVEHFKYGSIGSEPGGSLFNPVGGVLPPYYVFKALPGVCPEKLPGGYASLGLVYEPGHGLPVGVTRRRRLGLEQVGLNCAVCHTGTVRERSGAGRRRWSGCRRINWIFSGSLNLCRIARWIRG